MAHGAPQQIFLLVGLGLFCLVLWMVRRRYLREEDSPLWIGGATILVGAMMAEIFLWQELNSAGFRVLEVVLFLFLLAIGLYHTTRLSRLSLQVKNLAQEIALLKTEREEAAKSDDTSHL